MVLARLKLLLISREKTLELLKSAINFWIAFVTEKALFLHLIYYNKNQMESLGIP